MACIPAGYRLHEKKARKRPQLSLASASVVGLGYRTARTASRKGRLVPDEPEIALELATPFLGSLYNASVPGNHFDRDELFQLPIQKKVRI